MRKIIIVGLIAAALGSTILARADGINIPAPSWTYAITSLGTGIATALGINVGSVGAPVLFNGAGGTPSSLTATNLSGTAASLTAGNVTTNANLTGDVTSVGNSTTIAGTAWSTYTSTPTCSGSPTTITAAGAFKLLGAKTSLLTINVTATNIGTCIGFLNLSAPASQTANRTCTLAATDNTTTTPKHASWGSGNTVVSVIGPANTFPVVSGDTLTVSGVCEIQ